VKEGIAGGCSEYGNGPSVFIKRNEFLDQLFDYQLTCKDFHPCY
jgi:hypothetical protein